MPGNKPPAYIPPSPSSQPPNFNNGRRVSGSIIRRLFFGPHRNISAKLILDNTHLISVLIFILLWSQCWNRLVLENVQMLNVFVKSSFVFLSKVRGIYFKSLHLTSYHFRFFNFWFQKNSTKCCKKCWFPTEKFIIHTISHSQIICYVYTHVC